MNQLAEKKITFSKAALKHKNIIFSWLDEPHVKAFWDNSQEHRDDILNFINNHKQTYFGGISTYWIGQIGNEPYCLLITSQYLDNQELSQLHRKNLSQTGKTYSIDFTIGHKDYLGRGLAAPTLEVFTQFIHDQVDVSVDTFLIDPDVNNPRATHVYEKAGFKRVGDFKVDDGYFSGHHSLLMVKKIFEKALEIIFGPLKESDLDMLHQWFQDPLIKQWYAAGNYFLKAILQINIYRAFKVKD